LSNGLALMFGGECAEDLDIGAAPTGEQFSFG
jgi:hypothetical protein